MPLQFWAAARLRSCAEGRGWFWYSSFHFLSDGGNASSFTRSWRAASRSAVRSMIDLLGRQHGMPAIDAYLLCSVCGDLRISEIVDVPNWTVSFYVPRIVFE